MRFPYVLERSGSQFSQEFPKFLYIQHYMLNAASQIQNLYVKKIQFQNLYVKFLHPDVKKEHWCLVKLQIKGFVVKDSSS